MVRYICNKTFYVNQQDAKGNLTGKKVTVTKDTEWILSQKKPVLSGTIRLERNLSSRFIEIFPDTLEECFDKVPVTMLKTQKGCPANFKKEHEAYSLILQKETIRCRDIEDRRKIHVIASYPTKEEAAVAYKKLTDASLMQQEAAKQGKKIIPIQIEGVFYIPPKKTARR